MDAFTSWVAETSLQLGSMSSLTSPVEHLAGSEMYYL